MRLKNDIQVKAFLIRNKIAFSKYEGFLEIDGTRIGDLTKDLLHPYICNEPVVCKKESLGKKPYIKKASVKHIGLDPEKLQRFAEEREVPKPVQRPPAEYSNKKFNS